MMQSDKQTAVVICPGRGTYNQAELGYLARHEPSSSDFLSSIDKARAASGQIPISELDAAERFKARLHGSGDNASALIYACALADFQQIDCERYDIIAVTGNSMGWYLALACAGVLPGLSGFNVVNTMGTLMHNQGAGGQVIYPLFNADWQLEDELVHFCDDVVARLNDETGVEIYHSIDLGGMIVFAANEQGVKRLLKELPPQQDRFPFQLQHHSAFHSPLLNHIPRIAKAELATNMFEVAQLPLIDGRGMIWQPRRYQTNSIYDYTFEHQVTQTYNFSKALEVSLKEFAPDKLIVLGPGTTLGPPIAQELIKHNWNGLNSKAEFQARQQEDPFVLSMGIEAQRALVV